MYTCETLNILRKVVEIKHRLFLDIQTPSLKSANKKFLHPSLLLSNTSNTSKKRRPDFSITVIGMTQKLFKSLTTVSTQGCVVCLDIRNFKLNMNLKVLSTKIQLKLNGLEKMDMK